MKMETTKLQFGVDAKAYAWMLPPKGAAPPYDGPLPRGKHSHRCQACGAGVDCYKGLCLLPQKVAKCRWCNA